MHVILEYKLKKEASYSRKEIDIKDSQSMLKMDKRLYNYNMWVYKLSVIMR